MEIPVPPAGPSRAQILDLGRPASTPLRSGQLLEAVVTRLLEDGRVQLSVAGRLLEAQFPSPLLEGQTLRLVVESAGPPPQFRLAADEPTTAGQGAGTGAAPAKGGETAVARPAEQTTAPPAQAARNTPATATQQTQQPAPATAVNVAAPARTLERLLVVEGIKPAVGEQAESPDTQQPAALLRPGRQFSAVVVPGPSPRQVVLRLTDGGELQTRPLAPGGARPADLEPGQPVRVRVEATGKEVVLRLTDPAQTRATMVQALRSALPRQDSLKPLTRLLDTVVRNDQLRQLPAPVRMSIEQAARLPRPVEQLATAAGLREALENSGLFLESRLLAKPETASATDSKAVLLRLAAVLLRYVNSAEAARAQGTAGAPAREPTTYDKPARTVAGYGPAGLPTGRPTVLPAEVPVGRPVATPIGRPVEIPLGRPIATPIGRPVEIPLGRPGEAPAGRSAEGGKTADSPAPPPPPVPRGQPQETPAPTAKGAEAPATRPLPPHPPRLPDAPAVRATADGEEPAPPQRSASSPALAPSPRPAAAPEGTGAVAPKPQATSAAAAQPAPAAAPAMRPAQPAADQAPPAPGRVTQAAAPTRAPERLLVLETVRPAAGERPVPAGASRPPSGLAPGQQLSATVEAGPAPGRVALRLPDGRELQARPFVAGRPVDLPPGQPVRIRVDAAGGALVLRLTDPPPATAAPPQESAGQPPRPFDALARHERLPQLPAPVRAVIEQAAQQPHLSEPPATEARLREVLEESGLLPQVQIHLSARAETPAGPDSREIQLRLAAALLRYLDSAEAARPPAANVPTREQAPHDQTPRPPAEPGAQGEGARGPRSAQPPPPTDSGDAAEPGNSPPRPGAALLDSLQTALRHTEGALARQQVHQLASVQRDETATPPTWVAELPVRHPDGVDTVEVQVRREGRRGGNGGNGGDHWSVTLNLEDERYGPMTFIVTLSGGAVSTSLWAQQAPTAELFRGRMDELRQRFDDLGLAVGRLGAFVGTPPRDAKADPDPLRGLLDLQA